MKEMREIFKRPGSLERSGEDLAVNPSELQFSFIVIYCEAGATPLRTAG